MPLLTWQLCLARYLVGDFHLPWQKPLTNLTPGRVVQSMFPLLVNIETPTLAPKRREKSPGCSPSQKRTPKTRYPVVKKGKSRFQKHRKVDF